MGCVEGFAAVALSVVPCLVSPWGAFPDSFLCLRGLVKGFLGRGRRPMPAVFVEVRVEKKLVPRCAIR